MRKICMYCFRNGFPECKDCVWPKGQKYPSKYHGNAFSEVALKDLAEPIKEGFRECEQ